MLPLKGSSVSADVLVENRMAHFLAHAANALASGSLGTLVDDPRGAEALSRSSIGVCGCREFWHWPPLRHPLRQPHLVSTLSNPLFLKFLGPWYCPGGHGCRARITPGILDREHWSQ